MPGRGGLLPGSSSYLPGNRYDRPGEGVCAPGDVLRHQEKPATPQEGVVFCRKGVLVRVNYPGAFILTGKSAN